MPSSFHRSRQTWLLYLAYSIYGYTLNGLGPATPFLKSELNLSYTVASLHFSAFAIGMILAGLGGHLVVARRGRKWVLWFSLVGMCLCELAVAFGRTAWMTVGASFLMGSIGSLISSVVPSGLADEHGENRAIALSELNLIAAMGSATAALVVGWFSYTLLGWRFALVLPILISLALWLGLGSTNLNARVAAGNAKDERPSGSLPGRFWLYWLALILVVSIEYCMVSWCADFMEKVAGLNRASAAQAVGLFQAGMILGRLTASRLLLRFPSFQILAVSMLVAGAGFLAFWMAPISWLVIIGLFFTGLGVASQYPIVLALALGAANGHTVQAGTRAGLASGIAIFSLPLVLGRLADALGIRLAYGVIPALLVAAFLLLSLSNRLAPHQKVQNAAS